MYRKCIDVVYARSEVPDVIVCLDGNFTQKRRRNGDRDYKDHPIHHPDTLFISEDSLHAMEAEVELKKNTSRRAQRTSQDPVEDEIEIGMQLPTSVLDSCGDSFIAADERREKASTRFFSDTGLMALLCRHDRPLFLANMTSAGEKQYYALALILELFKHLPPAVVIGLLYDIGCQLDRSCTKWDFLPEYRHRIVFALAVFHAYGHQWPCQLLYHPRKRVGFGLSDGEGCERFWSMLKKLIPGLRVSGVSPPSFISISRCVAKIHQYHQRLLVLDTQIEHNAVGAIKDLGNWIARRWTSCQQRHTEADLELQDCEVGEAVLRAEWQAQVAAQTRPLPSTSGTLFFP